MKRFSWLIPILLLLALPASGQGVRYDGNVFTAASNVPYGAQAPMYTLPFAKISICAYPASGGPCTNYASVYADQGMTMLLTPPLVADAQGRYGFWTTAGTYSYSVVTAAGVYVGTYIANLGAGGSNTTYISGIAPITVTGSGTSATPYIVSLATPFTINSFTGCNGNLELGATITNPTCNVTYSATPTSASIANSDGINSPFTMSTPFTTATIAGSFTHASIATTTFTVTAVGASTQMASQAYTWRPRSFGGVGAGGASSAVTATGSNALLSTGDTLPSAGLLSTAVGVTFGPFTTSSQKVYLLLIGGTHTFKDPNTGFPFAFNAPTLVTFINANGVSVTMYLYESTNLLYGAYSVLVLT
jgi:hypothetical protein